MPMRPKSACPRCRRVRCICDSLPAKPKRKPFASARNQRRAGRTAAEIARRKAAVDGWRAQYGNLCPHCGRRGVKLTADHITPVGLGGSEHGPLGVMCIECARSQGAKVANARRRGRA